EYLYSTFIQRTLHSGNVMDPQDFFLDASCDRPFCKHSKVSMGHFNLAHLIEKLNTCFATVEIVLFEEIVKGQFLDQDIGIHDRENHSLGQFSFCILSRIEQLLSVFGLSLANAERERALNDTALLSGRATVRNRFPLRPILSKIDRGKKIQRVYEVIDSFESIMDRETKFYDELERLRQ
ncbi:MAG: hypothetical protein ABJ364_08375, partial [Lentilitoribacter sp.]